MSTLAIYEKIDELYILYKNALQNNITHISISGGDETLDQYLSAYVLTYVFTNWKEYNEALKFINFVRQHNIIVYDKIILHLISESRFDSIKNKIKIKDLINLSQKDKYQLNYQKLLNHAIDNDVSDVVDLIKDSADKIKYQFNFDAIKKNIKYIKKIYNWSKLSNQKINLDIQKFFETARKCEYQYLEYLLKLNKDEYNQDLNFNRILSLPTTVEFTNLVKKYIPKNYKLDVYTEELEITLKNYSIVELTSVLNDLIRYCYVTTDIAYIEYKNKKYYNSSNQWYEREEREEDKNRNYDPDIECENYMENCEFDMIHPKNPDDVKYIIDYNKDETHWTDDYENIDLIRKISNANIEKVTLMGYDFINIINKHGINHDHRGSNHCKIYLETYGNYKINLSTNLLQFANCLYRIKSHKWDTNYEMYCGINTPYTKTHELYDKSKLTKEHGLYVSFMFDHGS